MPESEIIENPMAELPIQPIPGVLEAWRYGSKLAIHASAWFLNPKNPYESFIEVLEENPTLAWRDFGAIPPQAMQKAIPSEETLRVLATHRVSPFDAEGAIFDWFKGDPRYEYYLHIDLSKSRDNTGWSMCHWVPEDGKVLVDFIRTWKPDRNWDLSFTRVKNTVLELHNRGFKLRVSTDGWQNLMLAEELGQIGIDVVQYSVDRGTGPYDTLISGLFSRRVDWPFNAEFIQEMTQLRLFRGQKYDHPSGRGGSKDTSDAVAGCVSRCILSITGMSLKETEIEPVILDTQLFAVEYVEVEGTPVPVFHGITDLMPKNARFGIRIDAVEDLLVVTVGRYAREAQLVMVDGYYVWEAQSYLDFGCESVIQFLSGLTDQVEVFAFSLNESVPLEILDFIKATGKRFTSALAARKRARGQLIRSTTVGRKSIQVLIQQIRKAAIRFPRVEQLIRDLKFLTEDNQLDRIFVRCLAGFLDFVLKQSAVGLESQPMAQPVATVQSPVQRMRGLMPTPGMGAIPGANPLDTIRSRYGYQPPVKPVASSGPRSHRNMPVPAVTRRSGR